MLIDATMSKVFVSPRSLKSLNANSAFFLFQESLFNYDFGRIFNLSVIHPSHIFINVS